MGETQTKIKKIKNIIFFITSDAKDVEELIKYIKQKVYEKFGKEIETEIEIIH